MIDYLQNIRHSGLWIINLEQFRPLIAGLASWQFQEGFNVLKMKRYILRSHDGCLYKVFGSGRAPIRLSSGFELTFQVVLVFHMPFLKDPPHTIQCRWEGKVEMEVYRCLIFSPSETCLVLWWQFLWYPSLCPWHGPRKFRILRIIWRKRKIKLVNPTSMN